ncbi:Baeyer-Villiger monooxygenase [Vanrija pseudolonga]|uniref:Baeyer-Villiger monooxygenase n=1 Tax=Vanrija pseudolonga TaxID=143232 RepID=A0AAF0YGX2_9TREE|nr:Baeyer-Villiger monooxygenase [Vanrija pseudolonga]
MTGTNPTETLDAVVLGAGVAGLYQLYQLRKAGYKVRVFEQGGDVGGTWYWNRYPGARFDSEAYIYQYLFDEDLYKGWTWSEKFPGQPEIERWLHYITDKLDLRKDIKFNARITSAHYDEGRGRWLIKTSAGDIIDSQFFISCGGMLSAPITDLFPNKDKFKGEVVYTSRYPAAGVDVKGKKVGVVGIGATGIQVIQTMAPESGHMTVFARTPQYTLPMKNPAIGQAEAEEYKGRFKEIKERIVNTFTGFEHDFTTTYAITTDSAERQKLMEDNYEDGSLKFWLATFPEIFTDPECSKLVSDFVAGKMKDRLKHDPHLLEVLVPKFEDYGFGTHRVPLERNYLEVYLRDNVTAVSVKNNPIVSFTDKGLKLKDGTEYELDVIIMATGFDAGSGALSSIDVRGRGGRSLTDEWNKDIRTTMGLGKHGYPNLLTTAVPLAPSAALCNMTTCLQQQTEWITGAIEDLKKDGKTTIEPTQAGEDAWVEHHDGIANATLVTKTDSWYMGSNVPGKPRRLLSYIGGVGVYRTKCNEEAEAGYPSFQRA